jgi:hypothetical protein
LKNYEVYREIKGNKYPDELTFDQFDMLKWDDEKQFGLSDDRALHEIAKDVRTYAQVTGGQIYTQIDGEEDRVYARGMHLVNRTGIWWVVKMKGFMVNNNG